MKILKNENTLTSRQVRVLLKENPPPTAPVFVSSPCHGQVFVGLYQADARVDRLKFRSGKETESRHRTVFYTGSAEGKLRVEKISGELT